LVRKLAADNGVDLAAVRGTGVGGRTRREDVLAAKPAPAAPIAPAPGGADARLPRLRSITAEQMAQPQGAVAQRSSVAEVDVTHINKLIYRSKEKFLAREGVELTFTPFFALATVEALKANPTFNAAILGDDVTYYAQENLGITVFTPSGPIIPVVNDAGSLGLTGLARAIAGVTARASGGALLPDDLLGGTFTLTAPGGQDLMLDFPIVTEPQVAILSVGAVKKRAVVIDDAIAVRSVTYLALSYDRRLISGTDAARFLATIKARLESGTFESELGL
jgi:2-oxoglutarate dehydrogenase E2 component (dihydrolipoamide succinyltransferase)